jgi:hypothetical protein
MFSGPSSNSHREASAGILSWRRLPARLNSVQVATLLGFQEHDIAPLVAARLLAPLGKPVPNAPKYFAAVDVEGAAQDRDWLSKATKALSQHWRAKNQSKTKTRLRSVNGSATESVVQTTSEV